MQNLYGNYNKQDRSNTRNDNNQNFFPSNDDKRNGGNISYDLNNSFSNMNMNNNRYNNPYNNPANFSAMNDSKEFSSNQAHSYNNNALPSNNYQSQTQGTSTSYLTDIQTSYRQYNPGSNTNSQQYNNLKPQGVQNANNINSFDPANYTYPTNVNNNFAQQNSMSPQMKLAYSNETNYNPPGNIYQRPSYQSNIDNKVANEPIPFSQNQFNQQNLISPNIARFPPPGIDYQSSQILNNSNQTIPNNSPTTPLIPTNAQQNYTNMNTSAPLNYPPASNIISNNPNVPYQAKPTYSQPSTYQSSSQSSKRIDPDSLPDPISLMEEDNKNYKNVVFESSVLSKVPPKSTTEFICVARNNCSPRFLRSTLYCVPTSSDVLKSTALTFGIVVQPYAETAHNEEIIQTIDHGASGPIRCHRCKAYINPHVKFINGGKHFICNLCNQTNDVPPEYFCHLDQRGIRLDVLNRPELINGSYQFVANNDYCRRNIPSSKITYIFAINVNYQSISSGYTQLVCDELINSINSDIWPIFSDKNDKLQSISISILAYDRRIYFFNSNMNKPHFHVVSDLEEPFLPIVSEFSLELISNKQKIIDCLRAIPKLFSSACETEVIMIPVVRSSLELTKATNSPVKLFMFHCGFPTFEAPGKLKTRDDRKLLGTDKQKLAFTPQNDYYSTIAKECVDNGLTIDMFFGNSNNPVDLSTIGLLATSTGGHIHRYSNINVIDCQIAEDIRLSLSRKIAFDCFLRLRTSSGIRPTNYYGNFVMTNSTDIELASIDTEQSLAIEIGFDEKLAEGSVVYLQSALLYTSFTGQRMIRIHNMALNTSSHASDVLKHCDQDTIITILVKKALSLTLQKTPMEISDSITSQCVQILANYRSSFAQSGSSDRLVLPETLKLLPLYYNSLLKSDMISGGYELSPDDRFYIYSIVMSMSVFNTLSLIYPRLILLGKNISEVNHSISANDPNLFDFATSDSNWPGCKIIRCSYDRIPSNGICLLDNGISFYLYLNYECTIEDRLLANLLSPDQISQVFRSTTTNQSQQSLTAIGGGGNNEPELIGDLPNIDTTISRYIRSMIHNIRLKRGRCTKLYIVRCNDRLDLWFKHYLVEDKSFHVQSMNYGDYLCHIFREIKNAAS